MIDIEIQEETLEIDMDMEAEGENVDVELEELFEKEVNGTSDYEKLKNLPTLDGVTIKGKMREKDPTVPEWAKNNTKPVYNAAETGSVPDDGGIPLSEIASWFT